MGPDMQPSRTVTVFQGLNFPFLPVLALGFYSGMGCCPTRAGGAPPLSLGCNPLYSGSEEHFGVSKEGVSVQPHSRVQPSREETGCAIKSCEFQLFPVDLAAPGAEEGARSLGQLLHPPLGPAQGIYFKGGMFFPKTLTRARHGAGKSQLPPEHRGKALSPSTC